MATRRSLNEVNENIDRRLKEIDASFREPFEYKNNKSKLKLICNKDNHEWNITYFCFINVNIYIFYL